MLKQQIVLSILLFITMFSLSAQYNLRIDVKGLRNNEGQVYFQLFDEKHNSLKGGHGAIVDKNCSFVFENLKPGKYGFNYFHDTNKNDKLDTNWMGIPKEGYGFSNNASGKFGPPAFEKWIFDLNQNKTMICSPLYLFN